MRKTLITGLVALIPLLITLYLLSYVVNLISTPFIGLSKKLLSEDFFGMYLDRNSHPWIEPLLATLLAFCFLFLTACFIGLLIRAFLKYYFITRPLNFLKKLPFLGFFLRLGLRIGIRVFEGKGLFFEKTVLVPFLGRNRYVIGLVTSFKKPSFIKKQNIDTVLLIPTAPHPLSGLLVLTEKQALKMTKLDTGEALNFIMSCGAKES